MRLQHKKTNVAKKGCITVLQYFFFLSTQGYDELVKLVHESEDALSRKIKEVKDVREKLQKSDESNHKLIVESQVLKRELLDIKESSTKDKHVSIRYGHSQQSAPFLFSNLKGCR